MPTISEIFSFIHLNKKFVNSNLIEKSFKDWSKKYLSLHTDSEYIDKIFEMFHLIEAIDIFEIENANKYTKTIRMLKLFDNLQEACESHELKIFAIEELKTNYYQLHPFIYGLMLHFYDIKFSEEIDEKITYITQWLEEIAYQCDDFYKKNSKKVKSLS